jgi:arginine/lysine/ornithine decarboxylase
VGSLRKKGSVVPIMQAIGKTAGEFKYIYPPGIPVIVPGEEITKETATLFSQPETKMKIIEGDEKYV